MNESSGEDNGHYQASHCIMVLLQATFCLVLSCLSMSRAATDFYSLSAVDINGNAVPLERFRGKVNAAIAIFPTKLC